MVEQLDVEFTECRNGSTSCTINGLSLHSSFNPEKEAQRFVDSLNPSYSPKYIIITGPCLPYCESYLRKKFPASRLVAIQFSDSFSRWNDKWDQSFVMRNVSDGNGISEQLFSLIGEENLFATYFVSWKPSEKIWTDLSLSLWSSFKYLMGKAESVISTRSFFNRRWFFNTIRFFSELKDVYIPEPLSCPIVITASGPSLKNALPFLKKYRKSFVLLSASSSIGPLLSYGLQPDMCISTDGGWWAKKHLEPLLRNKPDFPLLASPESAVPSELLNKKIIPLSYRDFPDSIFFELLNIPSITGKRNGTVSGTAAEAALTLTSGPLFFCGLDLAAGKGYQHTQPNEIEIIHSCSDTRIKNIETRASAGTVSGSSSLEIYRNWFSTRNSNFHRRVSRLVTKADNLLPIGNLKDIFIDAAIPDCFSETSEHEFRLSHIELETSSFPGKIQTYLKSVRDQIEHNPSCEYNYEWLKLSSLKELVLNARTGTNHIQDEIVQNALSFIDSAIMFQKKLSS